MANPGTADTSTGAKTTLAPSMHHASHTLQMARPCALEDDNGGSL